MSINHEDPTEHTGIGVYLTVFAILLLLTAATVAAAFCNFGAFNTPIALTIAVVKAVLVMLFFMHLKESSGLIKLLVVCAFVWLVLMIGMTLNDFLARNWGPRLEPGSWITRTPHQYLPPVIPNDEAISVKAHT